MWLFRKKKHDPLVAMRNKRLDALSSLHDTLKKSVSETKDLANSLGLKLENELRSVQKKVKAISDTLRDALICTDSRGNIISFNPAAENMFGYSEHETIGMNVCALIGHGGMTRKGNHEELMHEKAKEFSADTHKVKHDPLFYLKTFSHSKNTKATTKDGRQLEIEISINILDPEETNPEKMAFICIVRDMTEKYKNERKLRDLQKVFDNSIDAILIFDGAGFKITNNAFNDQFDENEIDLFVEKLKPAISANISQHVFEIEVQNKILNVIVISGKETDTAYYITIIKEAT